MYHGAKDRIQTFPGPQLAILLFNCLFSLLIHPRTGFAWQSLLPVLISKAPELMQIPASAGVEGVGVVQTAEFPHAFPAQYARILLVQSAQQNGADARTMALKKLAKLLHFVTSAYLKDDAGMFACICAKNMYLICCRPLCVRIGLHSLRTPLNNTRLYILFSPRLSFLTQAMCVW